MEEHRKRKRINQPELSGEESFRPLQKKTTAGHNFPLHSEQRGEIWKCFQVEKNLQLQKLFTLNSSTWVIHGSSLPQMRGTGYAAVVLHRKCPVTKQMR